MKKYWFGPTFVVQFDFGKFWVFKLAMGKPAQCYFCGPSGFEAQLFKERLERERDR